MEKNKMVKKCANHKTTIWNGLFVKPFQGQTLSLERPSPNTVIILELCAYTDGPRCLKQYDFLVLAIYFHWAVDRLDVWHLTCSCEGGTHRGTSGNLCTVLFLQLWSKKTYPGSLNWLSTLALPSAAVTTFPW